MQQSPFSIDWTDLAAVCDYARFMGSGMTVHKSPDRDNYNICHTERPELFEGHEIVLQT